MRYLKEWTEYTSTYSSSDYLINKDLENPLLIIRFIEHFKLSKEILDVWNYAKSINIFPLKIDTNEILYLAKDGSTIKLTLEGDKIINLKKTRKEYIDLSFRTVSLFNVKFSYERFQELIDLNI